MMPMQSSIGSMSMMAAMGLRVNAPLGYGWAGYTGGISGVAGIYGQMGMHGAMMAGGLAMPGPQAMGMVQMAGAGAMGIMDNTIEVAGKGMGKSQKYKMFPGELLAVHSVLKNAKGKSLKPAELQKQLKEKYGIDTEIKKVKGKQTLVNKATGHTIMSDGNGNNIMDMGDMKFKDALKQIKEKYGMDPNQFEQMYNKQKGGMGATTGMNVPMAGGVMGLQGMNRLGGYYPFGMGQAGGAMAGYGIWGDPMWQNSIFGLFSSAYRYAGMYG